MSGKKWSSLLIIMCAVLLCDFLSKAYVHSFLPLMQFSSPIYPYGGIAVFKEWHGIDFCITHVKNKGAAWGLFASLSDYLLYFRMVIIGGLLTYLFLFKGSSTRLVALTLIAGGAIGNVLDFFIYGHVVDMFYFIFWGYSYPVFNVADSAIFCGILLIVLQNAFSNLSFKRSSKSKAQEASR